MKIFANHLLIGPILVPGSTIFPLAHAKAFTSKVTAYDNSVSEVAMYRKGIGWQLVP